MYFSLLLVFLGCSLLTHKTLADCEAGYDLTPGSSTICVGDGVSFDGGFFQNGDCEGTGGADPRAYFQWFVDNHAVTPVRIGNGNYPQRDNFFYAFPSLGTHTVSYKTYPFTGGPAPTGVPLGSFGGGGLVATVTVESDNLSITSAGPTTPTPATVGTSVSFAATPATNPDCGFLYTYHWDFNDGTTSTAVTPSHTFTNPGVYNVAVTIGDGSSTATTTFQVTILPVIGTSPDFYLMPNPANLSLLAGTSGSVTVNVVPVNGFTGTVNLSLLSAPTGVWLYPPSVTIGPYNGDATLYVCVPVGSYSPVVQGVSGSLTHTDTIHITAH